MAPWLRLLEAWMVQQLLRTPAFHRAVEKVARGVHRIRHGVPPEELGGTKIDQPGKSGFMQHFVEEVKTQLGRAESRDSAGVNIDARALDSHSIKNSVNKKALSAGEEDADAAWQSAQKNISKAPSQGFMDEYINALREQARGGKKT